MTQKLPWQQILLLTLLFFAFLFLLTYGNYNFAVSQPGGTDFLFRWKPTQLVLLEGFDSPYDPDALQEVMVLHYGENVDFNQKWPDIFLYPYYVMLIFSPFAFIKNYLVARALWMTLIEVAHITILFLTFGILNYKPEKSTVFLLGLFSIACSYFTQGLIDGNPASIVTLFIALSLFFTVKQKDGLAGVFLALSTMKPQLAFLFFALMWLWAFSNRRWKIITSSSITLEYYWEVPSSSCPAGLKNSLMGFYFMALSHHPSHQKHSFKYGFRLLPNGLLLSSHWPVSSSLPGHGKVSGKRSSHIFSGQHVLLL